MGPANNVTDLLRPKTHRCNAVVLSDILWKQKGKNEKPNL